MPKKISSPNFTNPKYFNNNPVTAKKNAPSLSITKPDFCFWLSNESQYSVGTP